MVEAEEGEDKKQNKHKTGDGAESDARDDTGFGPVVEALVRGGDGEDVVLSFGEGHGAEDVHAGESV